MSAEFGKRLRKISGHEAFVKLANVLGVTLEELLVGGIQGIEIQSLSGKIGERMKNLGSYLSAYLLIAGVALASKQVRAEDERISLTQVGSNVYALNLQGQYLVCLHSKPSIGGFSITHGRSIGLPKDVRGGIALSIGDGVAGNFCHNISTEVFTKSFKLFIADESVFDGDSFGKLAQLIKGRSYILSINGIKVGSISIAANGVATFLPQADLDFRN